MNTALVEPTPTATKTTGSFIKWFREIGIEEVPLVGGKTASLGACFVSLRRRT